MLEIQRYIDMIADIREANKALKEQYALNIREETLTAPIAEWSSKRYPVFIYNYTKDSPMGTRIAQEARGLVLDEYGEIVSSSFEYIPELNSHTADSIDWSSAMAELQKDGVLAVIYSYKHKWFVQTRESASADDALPDCGISYRAYIHSILKEYFGAKDPFKPFRDYLDDDICYAFEFVSPYIRKVTPYRDSNIILLSAFNKVSREEKPAAWLHAFNQDFADRKFKQIRKHVVNEPRDVHALVACMESTAKGAIVRDRFSNRLKMPNPKYKELKKIVDIGYNLTPKHVAKAIIAGPGAQLGVVHDAYNDVTNMFFDSLVELSDEILTAWDKNSVFERKSYFAEIIAHYPKITRSVLFMLRRKQVENMQEALERINPELIVKVVKKKYGAEFDKKFDEMTKMLKTWRQKA